MLVELVLCPVTFCGAPSGSDVEIQSYYAIKSRIKNCIGNFSEMNLKAVRRTSVSYSQFHRGDANYDKFCYIGGIFS